MKPMSHHADKVYKQLLAIAYSKAGEEPYTNADLLELINHNLSTNEQRRLGRKFSYHAKRKPHYFEIVGKKGNNNIYRTL